MALGDDISTVIRTDLI